VGVEALELFTGREAAEAVVQAWGRDEPDQAGTLRVHTVTTPKRRLKSGNEAHELTTEECRRGAERTNELKRQRREAAEAKLLLAVDEAIDCLIEELRSKGADRTRAAVHILDRVLGKATQQVEGRLELRRAELVEQAKRELSEEHAMQIKAEAPAARAKLDRLLENRARQIAEENGDGDA
jgi:hypothetical protein